MELTSKNNTIPIVLGLVLLLAVISSVAIAWITRDPQTKAGQLRRSLEAVSNETERRDREIEELTGTTREK